MKKTYAFLGLALLFFCHDAFLPAQEALKSVEEEYYDFLSLQGIVEKPALNYRTLSDSVWNFAECELAGQGEYMDSSDYGRNGGESATEERDVMSTAEKNGAAKTAQKAVHPWQDNNLGTTFTLLNTGSPDTNWYLKGIKRSITARIYGPQWFNSFNTAAPYGQNDGALWQGRGYNTSLTAGARLEGYGLELTFKPQVSFSQNLEFEIMKSNCDSGYGYFWGYAKNVGVDAPQRFGDRPFWNFDWGDSEIRYSWHTFTVGFGTQSPWIGPAWLNPMLGSNNAASYPKFDIGLRKTKVTIPGLGWYLGDIEARIWTGYLSESNYFDNSPDNDHNQISGFSVACSPSFMPGFTLGATKICLSKWGENFWKYLNPFYSDNDVYGVGEDQKMSMFFDWICPKVGFELYGEIGIDDYLQGGAFLGTVRYPFDTLIWTAGLKKTFVLSAEKSVYGEFIAEASVMDLPRNKGKQCYYAFNFHHQITQGFTNKGQYLGSMYGNGGNSQILMMKVYYPKGISSVLIGRNNPDNTYSCNTLNNHNETYKANFILALDSTYFLTKNFSVGGGIVYDLIINSKYWKTDDEGKIRGTDDINNFQFSVELKYNF